MKNFFSNAVVCFVCLFPTSPVMAELPFMAHLAGETDLPKPVGISIDYFHMEQGYQLESLNFEFPGLMVGNPTDLEITSETEYLDLKFDAWVLPFLNAFLLVGDLDGSTVVKLSDAQVPGLPVPLNDLKIDIEGTVLGVGITLAFGGDTWFGSITTTYTEADVDALFASSVESFSLQPRLGLRYGRFDVWLSAMYLEITEEHKGGIDLGVSNLPSVNFDLSLEPNEDINYGLGGRLKLTDSLDATLEVGFGERDHQLLSLTYRY